MVNDVFADDRFPEGTGWGDPTLTSVICVPVITRNEECSGVIELFRDNGIDYVQVVSNYIYIYMLCLNLFTIIVCFGLAKPGCSYGCQRLDGLSHRATAKKNCAGAT